MADEQHSPPGVYGIDHAFQALTKHLDALLTQQHQELLAAIRRIERIESSMASQLEELDQKLDNVANFETQLGLDIDTVITFLKNMPNPPTDLSAQIAKLDGISQKLIDTDSSVLANLPPVPAPPVPPARRRK